MLLGVVIAKNWSLHGYNLGQPLLSNNLMSEWHVSMQLSKPLNKIIDSKGICCDYYKPFAVNKMNVFAGSLMNCHIDCHINIPEFVYFKTFDCCCYWITVGCICSASLQQQYV